MAFAGGPFNNFVFQATAAMVRVLRDDPASLGLVSTVCGLLTKPGLAVWSSSADGGPPLLSDLAAEAARATAAVGVTDDHHGRARVASCTVSYRGMDPATTFVLADTDDGHRVLATTDDPGLAQAALAGALIGTEVTVAGPRIEF
jgi:acetyl-CoA C-acetyltransferase